MVYSNRAIADIVFGICLTSIIGFCVFSLDLSRQDTRENRRLEPFPQICADSKINTKWAAQTENYVSDRLSVRDDMIDLHSRLLSAFDRRGNKTVMVGREGWLFLNYAPNSHNFGQLHYVQNKIGFTAAQLAKIKADLIKIRDWAAERDIKFYVYFPPDKLTVYRDYYPPYVRLSDKPTLVSTVEKAIKDDINVVSLEDIFLKFRRDDFLHYKTESHWAPAGAHLAYLSIMRRLQQDFKNLHALDEGDMDISMTDEVISSIYPDGKRKIYKGNEYNMLGRPDYIDVVKPIYKKYTFKNQSRIQTVSKPPYETAHNAAGQDLRVYVIGDSYNDFMFPFMAATFKDVRKVRINGVKTQAQWGIRFSDRASDIEGFKPDVLLMGISDLKLIELLKIWE